ncbi:MAG: YwiC-like family protein [Trueperella sp.]|nr:YwiC-like family protein [Trueperella sp.]
MGTKPEARITPAARTRGWLPKQHGAWAMLVVPLLLGVLAAGQAGELSSAHITLFPFWLLGYFAFNAASGWLKTAARLRPRYVPAIVTYSLAATVFGIATLALAGWRLLLWVPVFGVLLVPALWLASQRKERATIGGFLTTLAAALMLPVARYLAWASVPKLAWPNDLPEVLAVTGVVFLYFFGTVLYVKTNIRQRGSRRYLIASYGYHLVTLVLAAVLYGVGLLPGWWLGIAAVLLVRAVIVPRLRLRPAPIGIIEVVISSAILVLAVVL